MPLNGTSVVISFFLICTNSFYFYFKYNRKTCHNWVANHYSKKISD